MQCKKQRKNYRQLIDIQEKYTEAMLKGLYLVKKQQIEY